MNLLLLASFALLQSEAPTSDPAQAGTSIRVHDEGAGCFHFDSRDYEWKAEPGGYRRGQAFVTSVSIEALRAELMSRAPVPADLLGQAGFDPSAAGAHRD